MTKVLIFSSNALETGRGGEFYTIDLAAGLKKYFKVYIVHTNLILENKILVNHERLIQEFQIRNLDIKNLERICFISKDIKGIKFSFPYFKDLLKFLKLCKKSDVVYNTLTNVKNTIITLLFSLLLPKTKFIIGYHRPLYSDKRFSLYNIKYRISILLISLRKRNIIHQTITNSAKEYLKKNFYKNKNDVYIIEGLELDKYFKRDNVKKNPKKLRFIYVGALNEEHKGIKTLTEAIDMFFADKSINDVEFYFYGVGPLEYLLEMLINKFPNKVKSFGYIDYRSLAHAYQAADIFVSSSRTEPFGRVIVESLAGECIVIATRTFGAKSILEGQKFGFLLDRLDSKHIFRKMKEVYEFWKKNPRSFRDLQKKAANYAFQKYSLDSEISKFKSLINKLTN